MLKIDIIISKKELYKNDKVADYYEDSNVLRLTFKSEEDYINFLNIELSYFDLIILFHLCLLLILYL